MLKVDWGRRTMSRTGMTPRRWNYLKRLKPSYGRYVYEGGTYDVGRNKAKRERRAADKERRARVSCTIARMSQQYDKDAASDYYNGRAPAPTREKWN